MAILVANILFFIGYAFMYGGAAYFFKYLYLAPEATKLGVLAIGIGAMAFPPLWVAIARRFSNSITWFAGCALLSAASFPLFLLHAAPPPPLPASYLPCGPGMASVVITLYFVTGDPAHS